MTSHPTGTPLTLSTHVLDAALGRPAAGLDVELLAPSPGAGSPRPLARARTDDDGRVAFDVELAAGPHTLLFATGPWFEAQSRATFWPEVALSFEATEDPAHHHVALLLGPFSYTCYRGS